MGGAIDGESHGGESPLSVTTGDSIGWIAQSGLIVKKRNQGVELEKQRGGFLFLAALAALYLPC